MTARSQDLACKQRTLSSQRKKGLLKAHAELIIRAAVRYCSGLLPARIGGNHNPDPSSKRCDSRQPRWACLSLISAVYGPVPATQTSAPHLGCFVQASPIVVEGFRPAGIRNLSRRALLRLGVGLTMAGAVRPRRWHSPAQLWARPRETRTGYRAPFTPPD